MSYENIFCSICKLIIHKKVPSYMSDRFIIADVRFFGIFEIIIYCMYAEREWQTHLDCDVWV